MSNKKEKNLRIVVFASGSGSNAQRIMEYFQESKNVEVVAVLSNNLQAGVIARSRKMGVPSLVFDRAGFEGNLLCDILASLTPDLIVLAGFLWKIPSHIVKKFSQKIINIHPSLLPKYGGKGMYGMRVHQQVIAQKETESGITIHWVNEDYDRGSVIFQKTLSILPDDTPESLAERIHQLEHTYFPQVIASILSNQEQ